MGRKPSADTLHTALRELYSHLDLDTLPPVALGVVQRAVDCDVAGYNEIDTARGRAVGVIVPESEAARVFPNLPIWERYMHQHPLLNHFRALPYDRPKRVSDVVTQEKFEELDIYREYFGPLGYRYQIVTHIPTRSTTIVGITQNRKRRDFTEADRNILELLWPHLCQAYENAATVTELKQAAQRHEIVMDRLDRGEISIDGSARVQHASAAAQRFLAEFLANDPLTGSSLPAAIATWAKQQIATLAGEAEELAHPAPLLLPGPHGTLAARLIRDARPGQFVIVLSRSARLDSPTPLMSMGLTAREADVLYWCVEGKSRDEISTILTISERTVQKHLEHVYAKLDVSNRVAAVTKAMEWVRW
jgi:DNA-binding CsgD family transcriptional regulator